MSEAFLKKPSFILGLGLIVPVLMMAFFFISAHFQTEPAAKAFNHYNVLMEMANGYQRTGANASFFVRDKTLYGRYSRADQGGGSIPKLYLYDAATHQLKELEFGPPSTPDEGAFDKNIPVLSAKDLSINTNPESPEGFVFTYGNGERYTAGGIINDLFFTRPDGGWGPRLQKGATSILIRPDGGDGELHFIGWVMPN